MATILSIMHWLWVGAISGTNLSTVITGRGTWREFRPGCVVPVNWARMSVTKYFVETWPESHAISPAVSRRRISATSTTMFRSISTRFGTRAELPPI